MARKPGTKASGSKPAGNVRAAPSAPPHQKRCFVISPIGAPQSDVREHADDVFKYIIRPAAERAGYFVHRGDHNTAPGMITDQMFQSILNDELLIAVLSGANPNVYFELAVAQSAARPVILLIDGKEPLPFDVSQQRAIYYDLKPTPLIEGAHANNVYNAIRMAERPQERTVPFAPTQTPLGAGTGPLTLLARQADQSTKSYTELLASSERFLMISGIALWNWHERTHYNDALLTRLDAGCAVKVLHMDEENPALPQMLNSSSSFDIVRGQILDSQRRWASLASRYPGVEARAVKRGIVMNQSTINEKGASVTPYHFSLSTTDSPTFVVRPGSALYDAQKMEFQRLWDANSPTAV